MKLPDNLRKVLFEDSDCMILDILKSYKLDVNSTFEDGQTVLFYACDYGHKEVVLGLLYSEADWDHRDKWGRTALHIAVERGRVDVVQMLLENGAAVDPLDAMHSTPLLYAVKKGHTAVVSKLLDHKADVNVCDENEASALFYAVQNDTLTMVEQLLKAGARSTHGVKNLPQAQCNEMRSLLQYYEVKPAWLRTHLADKELSHEVMLKCEAILVRQEGICSEEELASTPPDVFNDAYLHGRGITGVGVKQQLLRLHRRLREEYAGVAPVEEEELGKRKLT